MIVSSRYFGDGFSALARKRLKSFKKQWSDACL